MQVSVVLQNEQGVVKTLTVDHETIAESSILKYNGEFYSYGGSGGRFFSEARFNLVKPPVDISHFDPELPPRAVNIHGSLEPDQVKLFAIAHDSQVCESIKIMQLRRDGLEVDIDHTDDMGRRETLVSESRILRRMITAIKDEYAPGYFRD